VGHELYSGFEIEFIVGSVSSASLMPDERIQPSMNDNDKYVVVSGDSALDVPHCLK